MPGFTLIYQPEGLTESVKDRAERLVQSSFKIDFISRTDQMILLFRDGNHYPYEVIEIERYVVIVEGEIYDIEDYSDKTFLSQLKGLGSKENIKHELKYFHELDGEFIIYLLDKKNEKHLVINDILGRLPAYVHQGRQFILSRDIYVLDKITTGLMFDEQSIYQFLRLGYPLGNRTLYDSISRFPSATLLTLNNDQVSFDSYGIDFNDLTNSYTGTKPEEPLYELFKEALVKRIQKEPKVVLSLSGGLDSRVIMGELIKNNHSLDFATFEYENTIIKNDVEVVRKLSKHYEKSPQYIELKEWAPELFDEIVSVKGGMNYVGMAFILDFLKKLGATHGLMLTGDGGDKTLPGLFPLRSISKNGLSKYILRSNALVSASSLHDFVTFETKDHEAELKQYLNSLEGMNPNMQYKAFQLFERAKNWLFEGEDRNRNYIWSTSPFYAPAFFKMAHSIPEDEKYNFNLFRNFIDLIDPELNKINNANWGIPLADQKRVDLMFWRQKIKSRIPFRFAAPRAQSNMQDELVWYVSELLHKGFGGQVLINADHYDLKACNTETLFHLLTLLKVSEMSWKEL